MRLALPCTLKKGYPHSQVRRSLANLSVVEGWQAHFVSHSQTPLQWGPRAWLCKQSQRLHAVTYVKSSGQVSWEGDGAIGQQCQPSRLT
jgi:hypothetical protein